MAQVSVYFLMHFLALEELRFEGVYMGLDGR